MSARRPPGRSTAEVQAAMRAIAAAGVPAREAMENLSRAAAAMGAAYGRTMRDVAERFGLALTSERRELVVDDPATWRPSSVRGTLEQMRAVFLHDFWTAAGEPERSPGARWVRRRAG